MVFVVATHFCYYHTKAATIIHKEIGVASQIWPKNLQISDRIEILDQWLFS